MEKSQKIVKDVYQAEYGYCLFCLMANQPLWVI